MKIYIDSDYKCHINFQEGYREVECSFFDNKSDSFIEGYRFVPEGEVWIRSDGRKFYGEMVSPWKDYNELLGHQNLFIENVLRVLIGE